MPQTRLSLQHSNTNYCMNLRRFTLLALVITTLVAGGLAPQLAYAVGGTSGTAGGAQGAAGTAGTDTSGGCPGQDSGTILNPLNNICNLTDLLNAILQGVVELGSVALVFMLVWVGFLFVAAQGNAEKIQSARSALMWTVIGGLVLLGAEAISQVIQATVATL